MPKELAQQIWAARVELKASAEGLMFSRHTDPRGRSQEIHSGTGCLKLSSSRSSRSSTVLCGHAYRRAWATARKGLSVTDVAHAGGWSDTSTLISCYQQADDETLPEVMSPEENHGKSSKCLILVLY